MSPRSEHTETVRRLIGGTDALENELIDAARKQMDQQEATPSELAGEFADEVRQVVLSGEALNDRALAMDGLLEAVAEEVDWTVLAEELLVRASV
jgi:hypothetical protein